MSAGSMWAASCWKCGWDGMTNTGDGAMMFTVGAWLCRAAVHEWMIPNCGIQLHTHMHRVPSQLYIYWCCVSCFSGCSGKHFYCLVYRLFLPGLTWMSILSWICFVSSAQFVENIDLFFGCFFLRLSSILKDQSFLPYSWCYVGQLIRANVWCCCVWMIQLTDTHAWLCIQSR